MTRHHRVASLDCTEYTRREAGSQERLVAISRSIEIAELTRQVFVEVVAYALRPSGDSCAVLGYKSLMMKLDAFASA